MRVTDMVPQALRALEEGTVLRRLVATALRALAVVFVVAGVVDVVLVLRAAFVEAPSPAATVAGVVIAVAILACALLAAQVAWYRAGSIDALPDSAHPVLGIAGVLARAAGETCAACFAVMGVFGALAAWLAPSFARYAFGWMPLLVPGLGLASGVTGGLVLLVSGVVSALLSLVVAYLLAEAIVVLADIARDVRALASGGAAPAASPRVATELPPPPFPEDEEPLIDPDRTHVMGSVSASTCVRCGSVVLPGARSCRRCGAGV